MTIPILSRQNPWWSDITALHEDPHIEEYHQAAIKWEPPYFSSLEVNQDCVYLIYGPRQVGKTTFFKLFIQRLIEEKSIAPRNILYVNCEALGALRPQELAETVRDYLLWVRTGSEDRCYIFLDEATYLKDWERSIKILADEGQLRNVTLFATGSHAAGLRRGGERLPGRRGRGAKLDLLMLPLDFRRFLLARKPHLTDKLVSIEAWDLKQLYQAAVEISLLADQIVPLFSIYVHTGGFPRSIRDEAEFGRVKEDIYLLYRNGFIGDLVRIGRRENLLRELIQWIINRRENPFDWSHIARETQLGTHPTVREYVEDAEAAFLWYVLYRPQNLGSSQRASRSARRVYFLDPFCFHAFRSWVFGYDNSWRATREFLADPTHWGYLVENIVAAHLRRYFGDHVFYWRNGQEIDFVVFREGKRFLLVEVKYRSRIQPQNARGLVQNGGGLLLTRDHLEFFPKENVAAIPVPYLLALIDTFG